MSQNILEVFFEKVIHKADDIAIKNDRRSFTFKELDDRSNQVSNLIQRHFNDQMIVPVLVDDDTEVIIYFLAILKLKKIYLPLSVDYPIERIEKIMADLHIQRILSNRSVVNQNGFGNKSKDCTFVLFEDSLLESNVLTCDVASISGEDVAYLLMTSGSTGEPKKVQVTHANLNWILKTMQTLYPFVSNDKFLFTTPCTFDVSLHEMLAFVYGEGIVVTMSEKQSLSKTRIIGDVVQREKITHLAMSPSIVSFLIRNDREFGQKFRSVKYFLLAGEELPSGLVMKLRHLVPDSKIVNLYGPTETTIYATHYEVTMMVDEASKIPIGLELPGTDILFVDEDGSVATDGEILIGGQGVSKGYYQDHKLTHEKFVLINDKRYYRTGDFGSRLPDGGIAFYGRKDDQVQINGIRVELEEIDSLLRKKFDGMYEFKTLYFNKKLVLFVEAEVTSNSSLQSVIREHLNSKFPSYMRPKQIIVLDKFPLSINRKLDRAKLIEHFNGVSHGNSSYVEGQQVNMAALIESIIQKKINSQQSLQLTDNLIELFALDSLENLEIVFEIEKQLGITLSEDTLNMYPTLGQLINHLEKKMDPRNSSDTSQVIRPSDMLIEQKQRVTENYMANAFRLIRMPYEIKETYYIQKSYFTDGFDSLIEMKIDVPTDCDKNRLQQAVTELLLSNVIFQISVFKDQEVLRFKHYEVPESFEYQLLSVDRVTKAHKEWVSNLLREKFVENAPKYYFLFSQATDQLYVYLSHYIFDQSSVYVLKKKFYSIIEQQSSRTEQVDYFDFIAFMDQNKNLGILEELYSEHGYQLVPSTKLVERTGDDVFQYISFDINSNWGTEELIKRANYILLKSLLAVNNFPAMSGSTIMNLREFNGMRFDQVLGDVHSTIPVVLTEHDDYEEYSRKFNVVFQEYKNGNNIYNLIYHSYPLIPKELKKYEFYLDDNLKFSSNYLGVIRREEIQQTIADIQELRQELRKFSATKLYATIFHTDQKLILIPLSNIELCLQTVSQMGGEVVNVN